MKTYEVQRMTEADYSNYLDGGYNFSVEKLHIEAETAEEAGKKAEADGYVVNYGYIKSVEELEAMKTAWEEELKAEAQKKAERKARAKAREAEKAREAGMTVEEYRAEKKRLKLIKDVTKEIEALKTELARKEALLKKLGA